MEGRGLWRERGEDVEMMRRYRNDKWECEVIVGSNVSFLVISSCFQSLLLGVIAMK